MLYTLLLRQRKVCMLLFCMLSSLIINAQTRITGKVTASDDKQPVIGASVKVQGSATGSVTGPDGTFAINAKSGDVLVITYIGYQTTQITVGSATNYNVVVSPSVSTLNEVVVTGYSSQRKKDITGAVTVVNIADTKSQPAADATSQLQGRASGVTVVQNGVPGTAATVRIRGIGSFSNNNPLYVVDGVQASNIDGLNPNDIESMTVLKDAASASIYGVNASSGVIVITTKKGKKSGVNVAYDAYYGSSNPGKGFDLLNAQETADLTFLARKNSKATNEKGVYGTGATPVLPDYIYASGVANGVLLKEGNPMVDPARYSLDYKRLGDTGYDPTIIVRANKQGTNWYNEITRNAPLQSHNITLSGANEGTRFLFSGNYLNQDAITTGQFYKRYTARMNSEFNIFNKVRIGENLQVRSSQSNLNVNNNNEGGIIAQTYRPMAIVPVYTINGDFAGNKGGDGFGTWGNAKNPVAVLSRTNEDRNTNFNLFGNAYAEVDLFKHLTARTSIGGNMNTANNSTLPFIEYEHNENAAVTAYNDNYFKNQNYLWTNLLTYKNTIGKHDFTVLAGEEASKFTGRQINGSAAGFFNYANRPYVNLQNGNVPTLNNSNIYIPTTTNSYFGKVDYAFDGKYLVSATLRRDGSSKFGADQRWGTFPAFSLGWRISDESFMKSAKFINDLKIRGSYGKMGNSAPITGNNAATTFGSNPGSYNYDIFGNQTSPETGFGQNFVGNPLGFWETSISTNIGFDATILGNTTDIVLDYYIKKTSDLLFNPRAQAIGGGVGVSNPNNRNVGSMENKGLDFMITNRTKITSDLKLNTTFTLTTYSNKITQINGPQQFFDFNSPANEANRIGGNATRNFVGEPVNTYFGYNVLGLFQSAAEVTASPKQTDAVPGRFKFEDVDGDGAITPADRKIIGNPNPDFTYGINLGTEYKHFDVSAFFYGVAGKDAFNFTKWFTDFSGGFPGGRSHAALYDSWLPDGSRPNATVPVQLTTEGFSSANAVSSYYVEKASYFRLRNLQIGYSLPVSSLSKLKASKLRLYIQGTNLFTVTKYSGLDPDITSTNDRAASVDVGSYPTVRQYLIGANLTF